MIFHQYKLCKVRKVLVGNKGVPAVSLHDGRTIRYPDPLVQVNDTVKVDLATNKITDFVKFDIGNLVMITAGRNLGRIGVITHKEKHPGSFDIVHIKDAAGQQFATRISNVFVIGKGTRAYVSLPKGKGVKKSILEEADAKRKRDHVAPEQKSS